MMKFFIMYYVKKKLLNLKGSKLSQILCADKTGFCRLGHKFPLPSLIKIQQLLNNTIIQIY